MIYQQGMIQKDVAVILGISEQTICRWTKKYEWKTARNKKVAEELKASPINEINGFINLNGFAQFLEGSDWRLYRKLLHELEKYVAFKKTSLDFQPGTDGKEAKQ